MSKSRRPTISIHDYPEHLNPFNDSSSNLPSQICKETKTTEKEPKHKFWTFGRSRKKRSHSFSIKSTWNGLFGKCKEAPEAPERRSMITTVSTTYKRDTVNPSENGRPVAMPRVSKDLQEFDEALGTLTRRRKYTWDNGSRYNSSLTVNGDPARIYDGSPQETTTSIMGDLTPKPPARKFGQVSPRPKDKIPSLNFDDKEPLSNGDLSAKDREPDYAPIPPRRSGLRSSLRFTPTSDVEEDGSKSTDVTLRDENENVPDDYVFKRFSQDAVRKSNLSINSCVSISSTASGFSRKKRRAPQPPRLKDSLETTEENSISPIKSQIVDQIEISRVAENINELTKMTQIEDESIQKSSPSLKESEPELLQEVKVMIAKIKDPNEDLSKDSSVEISSSSIKPEGEEIANTEDETSQEESVEIEFRRESGNSLEIVKEITSPEELRRKKPPVLSRSNSLSVKEEIEKIENQIKVLEARRNSEEDSTDCNSNNTRLSIQENRRHFFQDLVDATGGVKVELKEFPREQKDIDIIKLADPPVFIEAPEETVKVIELHISEPIRQKPEIVVDNPIPKSRRSSALGLERKPSNRDINQEDFHPRGSSL